LRVSNDGSHGSDLAHFSYNLAKNLADIGGYNRTTFARAGSGYSTNSYDPDLDYGNVPYTRRHRFLVLV
jgi:hypothetical protein